MPLARRLSSSSHDKFTNFCTNNKPLSRRLSNNGDASSVSSASRHKMIVEDKGQRLLKRRSISTSNCIYGRPKTRTSSSSLHKEQKGTSISSPKLKKQRTTHNDSRIRTDKENGGNSDVECLMLSPTPYWKVAKERGDIHSPRETRSAKKKKNSKNDTSRALNFDSVVARTAVEDGSLNKTEDRDDLLLFSPPNQTANARREKMDLERKTKERDNRIKEKRKSGQLLVYSKNLENLNPLAIDRETESDDDDDVDDNDTDNDNDNGNDNDDDDNDNRTEHSTKTVKQKVRQKSGVMLNKNRSSNYSSNASKEMDSAETEEENNVSSFSVDNERQLSELEEVSCLTKSTNHHGENSQEMMTVIKGLDKKFEILESRLSDFSELRPPQLKIDENPNPNMLKELDKKSGQVKELLEANLRLEEKNEHLDLHMKSTKSELSSERQKFTTIETEFGAFKITLHKYKEKYDVMNNDVLPRTKNELQNSLEELQKYKERVNQTSSKLEECEQNIERLKLENDRLLREAAKEKIHFQSLNVESHRAHQKQNHESEMKDQIIRDIQHSLTLTKKELEDERFLTAERMSELQNALNQLKDATTKREELYCQFSEFKDEIVIKNKENNSAIGVIEEQRDCIRNRVQELEKELKSVKEEKSNAILRLSTSDKREDELFSRLQESDRVRKELHSRVMVLIGSIRVFVRIRPTPPEELEVSNSQKPGMKGDEDKVFKFPTGFDALDGNKSSKYGCDDPTKNMLEVQEPWKDRGGLSQRRKKWSFGFDNIFDPSHSQEDVWGASEPLVQCAIDGFNVTLFAYGQTGSGKTFTMLGDNGSPVNEGIIPRSIRKLFDAKAQIEELSKGEKRITMSVELLEIYNEQVRDLLSTKAAGDCGQEKSLKIAGNKAVGSIHQPVANEAGVFKILQSALQRRTVKSTSSNATSSRSHLLFTIEFCVMSKDGTKQVGKLHVCDLAGSERLSKSGANETGRGALLKETQHINLSLSNLSNVIEKLQNGDKNVPFRNSKLTSLLQNSLGGNSKTLCIVCCNPSQTHFHENLCSLRFAAKINKVDLKSVQNFSA
mmetsp:Transcript_12373/g.14180  ORF Transcript_12373/g.14180 Transcript_12373/m.14180 type:complete len:1066 (-) Transcript_12373:200-3397(-)